MIEDGPMQDPALVTEVLGDKCPYCGWRRGEHRPASPGGWVYPCPQWKPIKS